MLIKIWLGVFSTCRVVSRAPLRNRERRHPRQIQERARLGRGICLTFAVLWAHGMVFFMRVSPA